MKDLELTKDDDFKRCVDFHGHICPGLSLGYRASKAGLAWLKENRAEDEEVVAIVESDACCADAVQVMTGCTFGKGNFMYKDYGKVAFTFLSRNTGRGVRIALKEGAFTLNDRHQELMRRMGEGSATEAEKEEFRQIHLKTSLDLLKMPFEQLFSLKPVQTQLPERARIEPSRPCARCGEPTMPSKLADVDGVLVCRACREHEKASSGSSQAF
jgi:formylmethanofuran dehydrogenase subunit E